MKCPECGSNASKVLYMGLPMNYCYDESCALLWGFWSNLLAWDIIPFNGMFFFYEGVISQGSVALAD